MLVGKEIFAPAVRSHDRLFLSFATLPVDGTPEGIADYERLAKVHDLPRENRASQFEALAAAKVFVEGMTAVGRFATREKLIEQLEQFYERPTGLTRPLTYGPNRRFGSRGAYVVGVDPKQPAKLVSVSRFIELSSP